jgi:hypothetical protein
MTWRVVGASVQGSSHAASGLPCQDAAIWRALPGGALVLAVADGAGSAAHSDVGAAAAVVAAVESLAASTGDAVAAGWPDAEDGWLTVMRAACAAAVESVAGVAANAGAPVREFATTLTCAVVAGPWLATAQIGDGLLVASTAGGVDGETFVAARPQRGEYANEAYFLTMSGALDYMAVAAYRRPIRALAASTDGLLRLALHLPACEPHLPFFRPLFAFTQQAGAADDGVHRDGRDGSRELVRFLDSPRVCARTDDDKTLVLAVWEPDGVTSAAPTECLLLGADYDWAQSGSDGAR